MASTGILSEAELAAAVAFLRRFARQSMGHDLRRRESTSDIVQSALREFLTLAQHGAIPPKLATQPWHALLARLAFRKIVDRARYHLVRVRHRQKLAVRDGGTTDPGRDDPSAAAATREQLQRLETALAQLPADQRTAVVLFYFEQLPHTEIAAHLERSVDASKMLLSRAMAKLGELLRAKA
ncbi:MAG: sigma-70 family RNA polymerase sigma factor [Planctomycetes bacterium]|nr:sigma-70 family RNA polymerase sigma factor [Planctomycetota bacterium]